MATKDAVSVVGIGLMGAAMARAFARAGHKTTVWNRSVAKSQALAADGVIVANSVAECLEASPLVVLVVGNPPAALDLLGTLPHASTKFNGKVVVDFISSSPSDILELQKMLIDRVGVSAYVSASILAFPKDVGKSESISLYSGNRKGFESVEQSLTALGTPMFVDEDPASASLQESVLLTSAYHSWAGFVQSVALLRTTQSFKTGGGTAMDFFESTYKPLLVGSLGVYEQMAKEIDARDYNAGEHGARLELHMHSLNTFIRTNAERGINTSALQAIAGLVANCIKKGGSENGFSSLVEEMANGQ